MKFSKTEFYRKALNVNKTGRLDKHAEFNALQGIPAASRTGKNLNGLSSQCWFYTILQPHLLSNKGKKTESSFVKSCASKN